MNNETLKKAVWLRDGIKSRQNMIDHFKLPIDNNIEEVIELLHGFNNLMFGFDREAVAAFMVMSFAQNIEKELKELEAELEAL